MFKKTFLTGLIPLACAASAIADDYTYSLTGSNGFEDSNQISSGTSINFPDSTESLVAENLATTTRSASSSDTIILPEGVYDMDLIMPDKAVYFSGDTLLTGTVEFASVTVAPNVTLGIGGQYTFNSAIVNAGTVLISAGALLDVTALITKEVGIFELTLTNGGTLIWGDDFESNYTNYFTQDSLDSVNSLYWECSDGVYRIFYEIVEIEQIITHSTGGTLNLGINETVDKASYTDEYKVIINSQSATLNLTTTIAPVELSISDDITVKVTATDGALLNSKDIIIGTGSTLEVATALLGDDVSFANSYNASTLSLDLGGETLSNYKGIDGFRGNLAISNGTYCVSDYAYYMDFASLTVNAGASFQLDGATLFKDYDVSINLVGGDNEAQAANFAADYCTISADFNLSGYTTISNGTHDINLNGDIRNSSTDDVLIVGGTATTHVRGDFNYTGDLQINGGTLALEGTVSGSMGNVTMAEGTSLTSANALSLVSISSVGDASVSTSNGLSVGSTLSLTAGTLSLEQGSVITASSITDVIATNVDATITSSSFTFAGTTSLDSVMIKAATATTVTGDLTVTSYSAGSASYATSLTIASGASMTITGDATSSSSGQMGITSFLVSEFPAAATVNINGTLSIASGISVRDGYAQINVNENGELNLGSGFYSVKNTGSITLDVMNGGTLNIANHEGASVMTVKLHDGATVNGTDASATNIAQSFTFVENASINMGATADSTMTINSNLTQGNYEVSLNTTTGTIELAGGANLSSVMVNEHSSLVINSVADIGSTTVAGALEITSAGSLTGDISLSAGDVQISEGGSLTSGNIMVSAAAESTAILGQASAQAATMTTNEVANARLESAIVTVTGNTTLTDSIITADSNLTISSGTLRVEGSSSIAANTSITNEAAINAGLITLSGNNAQVNYDAEGILTQNSIEHATIDGASITVAASDTTPVVQSSSVESSKLRTSDVATIEDTQTVAPAGAYMSNLTLNNTTVIMQSGSTLHMNSVIVSGNTTFTIETGATGTTINASNLSINAATGSNLSIVDTATYKIDTLAAIDTVNLSNALNIILTLDNAEYEALSSVLYGESGVAGSDISFTLEGKVDFEALTEATITLINSAATNDSITFNALAGDISGGSNSSLVFTLGTNDIIPEPSTSALSLLAIAGLLARRRRSRKG